MGSLPKVESQLLESKILRGIALGIPQKARLSVSLQLARAAIAVLGISALAWAISALGFPSPESLSILYVLPVLYSAIFLGTGMALGTAMISVLAYNYTLLQPIGHIGLFEAENIAKLAILSLVALISSALIYKIRTMTMEAAGREQILSGVYALSQDVLGIANVTDMRIAAETKLREMLSADCSIVLDGEQQSNDEPLRVCLEKNTPVGRDTAYFADRQDLYLPLDGSSGAIGVLRILGNRDIPDHASQFSPKMLATLAAQTASALEKAMLAETYDRNLREVEKEKFRSALLSSVTHDFRTPLVTVIGALSSLQSMPTITQDANCRDLVTGGLEEAKKLNRFIGNLVEICRLEAGFEEIRKEPTLLRDILAGALKTLFPLIGQQRFTVSVEPDFPLLRVNPALLELVFQNLLENAIKYGPRTGEIKVIARWDGEFAMIDIDDDGEGIPETDRDAVFAKFYRGRQGDGRIAGTGLGLYICREIIKVHGGTIAAIDPHDGQGACVRIVLPASVVVPITVEKEIEEA